MALSGNELVDIRKPDGKGNPAALATSVPLSQLTSLPVGTTIDVTPAMTNGNQTAGPSPVRVSALGAVGINDTVEVSTPINTAAGISASRRAVLASDVNAFVS